MATLFGGAVSPKKALPFQLKPYDRRTQKSGKPLIKNSISSDAFDCNEENQGRDTNDSLSGQKRRVGFRRSLSPLSSLRKRYIEAIAEETEINKRKGLKADDLEDNKIDHISSKIHVSLQPKNITKQQLIIKRHNRIDRTNIESIANLSLSPIRAVKNLTNVPDHNSISTDQTLKSWSNEMNKIDHPYESRGNDRISNQWERNENKLSKNLKWKQQQSQNLHLLPIAQNEKVHHQDQSPRLHNRHSPIDSPLISPLTYNDYIKTPKKDNLSTRIISHHQKNNNFTRGRSPKQQIVTPIQTQDSGLRRSLSPPFLHRRNFFYNHIKDSSVQQKSVVHSNEKSGLSLVKNKQISSHTSILKKKGQVQSYTSISNRSFCDDHTPTTDEETFSSHEMTYNDNVDGYVNRGSSVGKKRVCFQASANVVLERENQSPRRSQSNLKHHALITPSPPSQKKSSNQVGTYRLQKKSFHSSDEMSSNSIDTNDQISNFVKSRVESFESFSSHGNLENKQASNPSIPHDPARDLDKTKSIEGKNISQIIDGSSVVALYVKELEKRSIELAKRQDILEQRIRRQLSLSPARARKDSKLTTTLPSRSKSASSAMKASHAHSNPQTNHYYEKTNIITGNTRSSTMVQPTENEELPTSYKRRWGVNLSPTNRGRNKYFSVSDHSVTAVSDANANNFDKGENDIVNKTKPHHDISRVDNSGLKSDISLSEYIPVKLGAMPILGSTAKSNTKPKILRNTEMEEMKNNHDASITKVSDTSIGSATTHNSVKARAKLYEAAQKANNKPANKNSNVSPKTTHMKTKPSSILSCDDEVVGLKSLKPNKSDKYRFNVKELTQERLNSKTGDILDNASFHEGKQKVFKQEVKTEQRLIITNDESKPNLTLLEKNKNDHFKQISTNSEENKERNPPSVIENEENDDINVASDTSEALSFPTQVVMKTCIYKDNNNDMTAQANQSKDEGKGSRKGTVKRTIELMNKRRNRLQKKQWNRINNNQQSFDANDDDTTLSSLTNPIYGENVKCDDCEKNRWESTSLNNIMFLSLLEKVKEDKDGELLSILKNLEELEARSEFISAISKLKSHTGSVNGNHCCQATSNQNKIDEIEKESSTDAPESTEKAPHDYDENKSELKSQETSQLSKLDNVKTIGKVKLLSKAFMSMKNEQGVSSSDDNMKKRNKIAKNQTKFTSVGGIVVKTTKIRALASKQNKNIVKNYTNVEAQKMSDMNELSEKKADIIHEEKNRNDPFEDFYIKKLNTTHDEHSKNPFDEVNLIQQSKKSLQPHSHDIIHQQRLNVEERMSTNPFEEIKGTSKCKVFDNKPKISPNPFENPALEKPTERKLKKISTNPFDNDSPDSHVKKNFYQFLENLNSFENQSKKNGNGKNPFDDMEDENIHNTTILKKPGDKNLLKPLKKREVFPDLLRNEKSREKLYKDISPASSKTLVEPDFLPTQTRNKTMESNFGQARTRAGPFPNSQNVNNIDARVPASRLRSQPILLRESTSTSFDEKNTVSSESTKGTCNAKDCCIDECSSYLENGIRNVVNNLELTLCANSKKNSEINDKKKRQLRLMTFNARQKIQIQNNRKSE